MSISIYINVEESDICFMHVGKETYFANKWVLFIQMIVHEAYKIFSNYDGTRETKLSRNVKIKNVKINK